MYYFSSVELVTIKTSLAVIYEMHEEKMLNHLFDFILVH